MKQLFLLTQLKYHCKDMAKKIFLCIYLLLCLYNKHKYILKLLYCLCVIGVYGYLWFCAFMWRPLANGDLNRPHDNIVIVNRCAPLISANTQIYIYIYICLICCREVLTTRRDVTQPTRSNLKPVRHQSGYLV